MRIGNRYAILAAAVLMQACLGATYSWSIFAQAAPSHVGLTRAQSPFTIFYIAFPLTMIGSGFLLRRFGPRGCSVLGGLIFGTGWMVGSLGGHSFAWTMLGVGVLGGIGVGFAYVIPISIGMQWFPRNKGLVTGIIVAGFAAGAAIVAQAATRLMADHGFTVFEVLRLLGLIFAAVVASAGLMMRYPHETEAAYGITEPTLDARSLIGDSGFRLLYLAMFAGLAGGLAVNANLRQLCPAIITNSGAIAVAIFALSNAAGRICWGFAFDRFLSTGAIRLNLLAQAALLLTGPLLIRTPGGLQILAGLAGFNYGGVLVLYASATAQRWGSRRVGQVYGWLFTANIPASLAPVLVAASFEWRATFTPALIALGLLLLVSGISTRAGSQAPATKMRDAAVQT